MIQYLLTQLSKQTDFIQKQHYELQKEVLIDRKNTPISRAIKNFVLVE